MAARVRADKDRAMGFRWQHYHTVWLWLFLAWMFCYIDRSLTGPVVSWMIGHNVAFLSDAPMPHALGGLIDGMFFAGYMLTQFPAGYLGDKYGRKVMIVLSTALASITTLITGLARSLVAFVAARVLTGLVEGAYYSNDRALLTSVTPERVRGLAQGVIFAGLAVGLTVATVATPVMLDAFASWWGAESSWFLPFIIFAVPTALVALGVWKFVRDPHGGSGYLRPLSRLLAICAVFLAAIMAAFYLTLDLRLGDVAQAAVVLAVAGVLIAVIYVFLGAKSSAVLKDRNLVLMYVSAIPILYTLWFFGFWALLLVSESASLGISGAALYAGFFGVANVAGYPLGGRIYDRARARGGARTRPYVLLCSAVAALVLLLGAYLHLGGADRLVLGVLIFAIGVPFAAMQTVHMTLTADLAPLGSMGQAFGMWNLVAEIGALLSPVVSGALRDLTGGWAAPAVLNGALLLISAALVRSVRRKNN
ncbi:MFS transporter [Methanomassiliicoccus luminyensis]|uniref:MFS transporter n=1 Tax=Methanomassiliicoccus luminyensis TaxID=1080712 RepID=UPI0011CAF6BA|nr:MFS transporter [Methanomassiliicoccus luminyensis]